MKGSISRRCACRQRGEDGKLGKQLGLKCPKLKSRRHGTWGYVLDVPAKPPRKRTQMRRGGFASRKEAQAALDKLKQRLGQGQEINDRETVGEWLRTWLASKRSVRPSTLRSYRQHVDSYLVPHVGSIPLEKLRVSHIGAMFAAI